MKKLVIIDYGSGNLHSAKKAFERANLENNCGYEIKLTTNPNDIKNADKIVVPGVGAFEDCVTGLMSLNGMFDEIKQQVLVSKKPFLGICVGMQMLATKGFENGEHNGLNFVAGEVKKIDLKPKSTNLKLPHMGWNNLCDIKQNQLTKNISENEDFYFVHSYHFICNDEYKTAQTEYGTKLTAIINKENIWGVQFHPEKSQKSGLKLISNFLFF